MMKNKNVNRPILVIIAIILLFAFSLQFSFATSINDTDDEGIKGALDSDDSVGTIHLNPGTYSGINNTNITVNKNVTFQGNGSPDRVVIDGENSNWLFNIQDNLTVKFINITFRNAVADNGAAIFNGFSSNVKFINCIFENNFAVNGGAIYNNKGTISVENSLFTNNQASNGGAIYNNGFFSVVGSNLTNNVAINGGAIYNNGYVRLSDSNLTYNVANIGGAVYNNENIIISNCEFFKNTALGNDLFIQIGPNSREVLSLSYKNVDDLAYLILSENIHGGAIYNHNDGQIKIYNSVFDYNNANDGGAIYNNGDIRIYDSTFVYNYANKGGAIYNNGNMTVFDGNFTDNIAVGIFGVIYNYAESQIRDGDTENPLNNPEDPLNNPENILDNIQIDGVSFGGAIYNSGKFTLIDSNFTYNNANVGGAIYNSGDVVASNCNFIDNYATSYNTYNLLIRENQQPREILQSSYENENLGDNENLNENENLGDNENLENNGRLSSGFRINRPGDNGLIISVTSFGGAIYNNGTFTLRGSNFTNNSANFGGAIYNSGDMDVSNCNFVENYALANCVNEMLAQANQRPQDILQLLDGGEVSRDIGDSENNFQINRAADDAAGLAIRNSLINSINVPSFGGAIYNSGTFTLSGSNFTNNSANSGGAIYNSGDMTVSGSNFIDNYATGFIRDADMAREMMRDAESQDNLRILSAADDAAGLELDRSSFGGAIYNNGTFTLRGSNFTNNSANFGGAIYNSGDMTASNCNFIENYASDRSQGILQLLDGNDMSRDIGDSESNLQINRNTDDADDAAGLAIRNSMNVDSFGGAIYNSGTFTLSGSNFTNNSANFGGAIYNSGNMNASNCNFVENYALAQYANNILAQANQRPQAILQLLDGGEVSRDIGDSENNFQINRAADDAAGLAISADSFGGAIYNSGTFTLSGSNFTNNSANFGGAIYNSGDMDVSNCNFVDNSALVNDLDISQENLGSPNINQLLRGLDDDGDDEGSDNGDGDDDLVDFPTRDSMIRTSCGGAIYNHNNGNITVFNSSFVNNTANNGGAIYNDGIFNLIKSNLTDNTANFYGGAIFNSGNMTVSGNNMTGNLAGIGINDESSESRIRDAEMDDDAAGLGISEKMRGMINNGLDDNEAYGYVIYNIGNMGGLVLTYLDNSTKSVKPGENITLYAHLTDDMGNPVTGQNISFIVNGTSIGSEISIEGYASVNYTVPNFLGSLPVNGDYDGHVDYPINILNGQLSFKKDTHLTVVAQDNIKIPALSKEGNSVNITGVLTDKEDNHIAKVNIDVTVNGKTYSALTDEFGRWTVIYTPTQSGIISVLVKFAGDDSYLSYENSTTFTVTKGKIFVKTTVTENTDGSITITANVTDDEGNPVADYPANFYKNGELIGTKNTDINGIASVTIFVADDGEYEFSVLVPGAEIDESSENTVFHSLERSPTDSVTNKDSDIVDSIDENTEDEENTENKAKTLSTGASMKNTGIPVLAIFLVFIALLGMGIRKKQK